MSSPLPLRSRPVDAVLAVALIGLAVGSVLFDSLIVFDLPVGPDEPSVIARLGWTYATEIGPLLRDPPTWVRICVSLSLFVYDPFYLLTAAALVRGWAWIQPIAVIVCTMICSFTGILFFGVELFGEPGLRSPQPLLYILANGPYVLVPLVLLVRMRRSDPFSRRF